MAIKTEIVKLNNGRFSVRLDSNQPSEYGNKSVPVKDFKYMKGAKKCKAKLSRMSNKKKNDFLWRGKKIRC